MNPDPLDQQEHEQDETDTVAEFIDNLSEIGSLSTHSTIPIDPETQQQLKTILETLTQTDIQIQQHITEIKRLRQVKLDLRKQSIQLMSRHKIDEINIRGPTNKCSYSVRQQTRKINPLTMRRLPDSLARYFIQCNRDSIEDAKRRAAAIIDWIRKHIVEETSTHVLSKRKIKE